MRALKNSITGDGLRRDEEGKIIESDASTSDSSDDEILARRRRVKSIRVTNKDGTQQVLSSPPSRYDLHGDKAALRLALDSTYYAEIERIKFRKSEHLSGGNLRGERGLYECLKT